MAKKQYSDYTKKLKKKLWIYRIIDFVILFVPLIIYVFMALGDGGLVKTTVGSKVAVSGTVVIAAILCAVNAIAQKHLRCPIWIIFIGLYIAFKQVLLPLIIELAIATIIDDLIISPRTAKLKVKMEASEVYDERREGEPQ